MSRQNCRVAILIVLVALASQLPSQANSYSTSASASAAASAAGSAVASAATSAFGVGGAPPTVANNVETDGGHHGPVVTNLALDTLKRKLVELANANPYMFDPEDVQQFLYDQGSVAAIRFLNQRSNVRRSFSLAKSALKWRKDVGLKQLQSSDFPCDLFMMGLIFEQGRAHQQTLDGQYEFTYPVIWLRLGALGSIVKQLEKFSASRLISFAYNTPRNVLRRASSAMKRSRSRSRLRRNSRYRNGDFSEPLINNMSVQGHETVGHVLKAIAWWLEDWVNRQPEDARATLVLDFENTDFAFASWSVGEFLIKLDDLFPDLFNQIIGFRYKPKLWSLHTPISMFNRIFKSRVASSPETDRKLKFVTTEPQMSAYIPRVDSQGFTMLPAYVSGICQAADESKAPPGCQANAIGGTGLYDPNFWAAIYNEFYYSCKAKARE